MPIIVLQCSKIGTQVDLVLFDMWCPTLVCQEQDAIKGIVHTCQIHDVEHGVWICVVVYVKAKAICTDAGPRCRLEAPEGKVRGWS
jgi:hypothetical protein